MMKQLSLVSGALALCLAVLGSRYVMAAEGEPVRKEGGESAEKKVDDGKQPEARQRPGDMRRLRQERGVNLEARMENRWERLDKNRDGVLTKEELPVRERLFSAMDKDGNGQITRAEHSEGMRARQHGPGRGWRAGRTMARLDKDQDQRLSKTEAPRLFRRSPNPDANGDGYISHEELLKVFGGRGERGARWLPRREIVRPRGNEVGNTSHEGQRTMTEAGSPP